MTHECEAPLKSPLQFGPLIFILKCLGLMLKCAQRRIAIKMVFFSHVPKPVMNEYFGRVKY